MPDLLLGPLLRHVDETSATVWVETDAPCEVSVLGCSTPTFTVAGHHYALVVCRSLQPGTTTAYDVRLDGRQAWPRPDDPYPAPTVRTRSGNAEEPLRLVFGSCRVTRPHVPPYTGTTGREGVGIDALHAYALRMLASPEPDWPDALLLLGDQVYADELSPGTLEHVRRTRGTDEPPGEGIADFHEYTVLYQEAWSHPLVRWVLSTVPTAMVFDDHDVHDDWNTSRAWRLTMQAEPWWPARIEGGLMAYWLYQHLGNLSPADLERDGLWAALKEVADGEELLREHARTADGEAGGGKGVRWSYRRDYGDVRLLVLDSRGGRVLDSGDRSMVDAAEWDWIVEQTRECASHLLLASSLPVLLPPALHDLEGWNEALCDGAWGSRAARLAEKLRQGADLEHWAAFRTSWDRLMALVADVGAGRHGPAPATITFLGGDVHFSYLSQARFPERLEVTSAVHQAVCSPVRNPVNRAVRTGDRFARTRAGRWVGRRLATSAGVPQPEVSWKLDHGPWFHNQIAALLLEGRSSLLRLEQAVLVDDRETLQLVVEEKLA